MTLEDIVEKLVSSTSYDKDEVEKLIYIKQQELSGLVSLEGAAYIVAKEMGLDLVKRKRKDFKIKDIIPGLRSLNVVGRVQRVFPAKEYEKNGNKFKVGNIILIDETGSIRMSLWDNQTEVLEKLEPGLALEIFGAYSKADGRGDVEIRIGRAGGIKQIEGKDLPDIKELKVTGPQYGNISDFHVGRTYKIRAMVAQVFENEQFYEICPHCGFRVRDKEGKFTCKDHGDVTPELTMVVSGVIDDGTGNTRSVFFRDMAGKFLGMSVEDAIKRRGKVFEHVDILGKEFLFQGRVRTNKMFNRPEFIVSDLWEIDEKKEAESILNVLAPNK